ncbi:MAG: hypothetical protein HY000_16770 [Planctomycetes bacterium]|nr:hypothetical protein [Planctomycetia bacterium]MBI3464687.1 hypothetical protein [Planctomycetota bacterium]
MSEVNERGWNRRAIAERTGRRDEVRGIVTEAEFYLNAGRTVRRRIRRGHRPPAIARALDMSVVEAFYALRYAESSPSLVLRALVEAWSWEKIKQSLRHWSNADRAAKARPG